MCISNKDRVATPFRPKIPEILPKNPRNSQINPRKWTKIPEISLKNNRQQNIPEKIPEKLEISKKTIN